MNNPNDLMSEFNKFRQNPQQYLFSRKINIPSEIINNPNQIIQYLMNNGQVSQQQYNSAMQQAQMFRPH